MSAEKKAPPVGICLVGVNNFANSHKRSIEQIVEEGLAEFTCVVIRSPERYPDAVEEYTQRGITIYNDYDRMLEEEKGRVDLVALPVAIHTHAEASIAAMEAGYDVLVEKPPAATVQDVDAMIATSEETGRFCAVGFQNQSKHTVRELKALICDGELGQVERITVMAEWVRDDAYYARNAWAGQMVLDGRYVLDGPTNNALAHYMFNALYWASPTWGHADSPARVRGELYRAHPIPGEDSSAIAVETLGGVHIVYVTTLAGWETRGPIIRVEGTGGTAHWDFQGPTQIEYADGSERVIEPDGRREHDEVFRNAIRYMLGEDDELNAPIAMTRPMTVAVNGAYESGGPPRTISDEHVTRERRGEKVFTGINGIGELLDDCYQRHITYSEAGAPWAYETEWFDTSEYSHFDMDLG
ncbi:MAG: Gfo/Idh/MocA family oxidoreductase [Armatimonadota bacterium]|nr:Gfo/Idh/MocA family oxidoreductase [Armatimonadota bacterium]